MLNQNKGYQMIEGRKQNPDFPKSRRTMAKKLNDAGGPVYLSRKLGVSRVTVHSWMKHYGIEVKRKFF